MDLKGSKTEKNILTAFAGESQARNRYSFYGAKAIKEGFEQIAEIFEETAEQERAHAKELFKCLEGGEALIEAKFPAGNIGTTAQNLRSAAAGEHYEWSEMYPTFAKIAREEGFDKIAKLFETISVAEKWHERRYLALNKNIEKGFVFNKESSVTWACRKCGYLHVNASAPDVCPLCGHPKAYFEVVAENY